MNRMNSIAIIIPNMAIQSPKRNVCSCIRIIATLVCITILLNRSKQNHFSSYSDQERQAYAYAY